MSNADNGTTEGLAEQRQRLASLASCEEQIRTLRDRECDLEVEHMAAQAALHSATNRLAPKIDPALASSIGHSLESRSELEERLRVAKESHGTAGLDPRRKRDQLRAGHAALLAWLEASEPREPGRVAGAAKLVMLAATIACVWAAIAIHPAFLLLLVVVVGPVSFAMARGQDDKWQRVGARRRFEASGLAELAEWNEHTVRARIAELESLLAHSGRNHPQTGDDASGGEALDAAALAARLADEDRQIASGLAAAGLTDEDTEGEIGHWLRLVARADRSRESLDRTKEARKRLRMEADEIRDQLGSYLHSRGVKPTAQQDTAADIAERLDSLSDPH